MAQRVLTPPELKQIEAIAKQFAKETNVAFGFQFNKLGLRSKAEVFQKIKDSNKVQKPLSESVKSKVKKRFGQVDSISFSYNWYGLFHDVGAANAFGKGVSLQKQAWKAAVINPRAKQLSNDLAKFYSNASVRAIIFTGKK